MRSILYPKEARHSTDGQKSDLIYDCLSLILIQSQVSYCFSKGDLYVCVCMCRPMCVYMYVCACVLSVLALKTANLCIISRTHEIKIMEFQ